MSWRYLWWYHTKYGVTLPFMFLTVKPPLCFKNKQSRAGEMVQYLSRCWLPHLTTWTQALGPEEDLLAGDLWPPYLHWGMHAPVPSEINKQKYNLFFKSNSTQTHTHTPLSFVTILVFFKNVFQYLSCGHIHFCPFSSDLSLLIEFLASFLALLFIPCGCNTGIMTPSVCL